MFGYDDGMLEVTTIGVSFGTPDGLLLGTDESFKICCADGEVLGSTFGSVYGIEPGIYERTYLGYFIGSLDGSNEGTVLGSPDVAL